MQSQVEHRDIMKGRNDKQVGCCYLPATVNEYLTKQFRGESFDFSLQFGAIQFMRDQKA